MPGMMVAFRCTTDTNILTKCEYFRYRGNSGRRAQIWMTPLNWPTQKTSSLKAKCGHIQAELQPTLCLNSQIFVTMQQGLIGGKFEWDR